MRFAKEYGEYMKIVVDIFANKLNHNTATPIEKYPIPKYRQENGKTIFDFTIDSNENILYLCDDVAGPFNGIVNQPKDIVEAWIRIENEHALKWLKKRSLTYKEWLNIYKQTIKLNEDSNEIEVELIGKALCTRAIKYNMSWEFEEQHEYNLYFTYFRYCNSNIS